MKMLTKMLALFVACACAFFAQAASVTADEAAWAARAWVAQGGTLGARLGGMVEKTTAVTVSDDASYYVVKMAGRGTVVTSSDTESEPIVAFLDTDADCTADDNSPLKALLARDAVVRANIRAAEAAAQAPVLFAAPLASGYLAAASPASSAARKWAALLDAPLRPKLASADPVASVDDERVAPLLSTKWSQMEAQSFACYNCYCVTNSEPEFPCGCTATAMAQVMKYHEYPKTALSPETFQVSWNDESVQKETIGGTYRWDLMALVPYDSENYPYTAEKWEAIGRLCWDCGLAIGSTYATNATAAHISDVPKALTNYFGYAAAKAFFSYNTLMDAYTNGTGRVTGETGLHDTATRRKVILTNLEAGLPVMLSIFGYPPTEIGDPAKWGGHAIVADGYGYSTIDAAKVEYVHLNMGWSGACDAWYNLPEVDANISPTGSAGFTYTVLGGAAYNISPAAKGELATGCVTNMDGTAQANIRVELCAKGAPYTVLQTTNTNAKGFWCFFAAPGDYIVRIAAQETASGACGAETSFTLTESQYVKEDSTCGNSWGNNLALEYAVAHIGTTNYASLAYALRNVQDGETIWIDAQAPLDEDFTLTKSIVIRQTDASGFITRPTGAKLTVAADVTLALQDILFSANDVQPKAIVVAAGGKLSVSGAVQLDMVETADAAGFEIAGEITSVSPALTVYCPAATALNAVFGSYTCGKEDADASAPKVKSGANSDFGGAANDGGGLYWTYAGGSGSVTDVRVIPLITSKWGQALAGGYPCYNYYCADTTYSTYGDGATNYPVGSAAVAIAQVARFFKYPDSIGPGSFACTWGGEPIEKALVGVNYFWDKMIDEPSAGNYSADTWEAIGSICWDAAVIMKSNFSATNENGTTTASMLDIARVLKEFPYMTGTQGFKYKSAVTCYSTNGVESGGILNDAALRDTIIRANLDAGRPVLLRLRGLRQGGDAGNPNDWGEYTVIADGYGYTGEAEYIHLNVGQGGAHNGWYEFPLAGPLALGMSGTANETVYDFNAIIGAVYNIHTNKTANQFAFVSGRVVKPDSTGAADMTVKIYAASDTERATVIASTVSDAKGCWKFELAPGTYVARVVDASFCDVESAPFTVSASTSYEEDVTPGTCGNAWGVRVNLIDPVARIGLMNYASLDEALAVVTAGKTVEILKDVAYDTDLTVPVSCTLKTADGNEPWPVKLTFAGEARLLVTNAVEATLQNLCVTSAVAHAVVVEAGGQLCVKGTLGLGIVETCEPTGFCISGPITNAASGISIYNATAAAANDQFGVYTCTDEEARIAALKLSNAISTDLGAEPGTTPGTLVWSATAVDPGKAVVADLTDPLHPKYYLSLDLALADVTETKTLVLRKPVSASVFKNAKTITPGTTLTLTGADATPVVVEPGSFAGFSVGAGSGLVVSNITFRNFSGGIGRSFIAVAGEGSSVTIGDHTTFRDFKTQWDGATGGLIVAGEKAHVTVLPGATFQSCQVTTVSDGGFGGAINMCCEEGTLDLKGGLFNGCRASEFGGAIYVYGGEKAVVNVSGPVAVNGNYRGGDGQVASVRDDIYMGSDASLLHVVGPLTASAGSLGVSYPFPDGWNDPSSNDVDSAFAVIDVTLTEEELAATAAVFRNDAQGLDFENRAYSSFRAKADAAGAAFLWYQPPADDGQCDPDDALFMIVHEDNAEPLYYDTVDKAFAHVSGDATVTMVTNAANAFYYKPIEIEHRVVLRSDPALGAVCAIRRKAKVPVHVSAAGELIVTNFAISGSGSGGGIYPLVQVEGGKFELQNGAELRNASGDESRGAGGVTVYQGTFTMRDGSSITNCSNRYFAGKDADNGIGGGLLVEGASTAYLLGGKINGCYTSPHVTNAAGVFIGNESAAYLAGKLKIFGNGSPVHRDLVVADKGYLYLDGALASDADVRIHYDVNADTNLAAYVSWTGWTLDELKASAARLRRGAVGTEYPTVTGVVVTNGASAAVVWSDFSQAYYAAKEGINYKPAFMPSGFMLSALPAPIRGGSLTLPTSYVSAHGADPESQEEDDGTVTLSFGEGTVGCWYYLYSAESLDAGATWNLVAEKYIGKQGDTVDFSDEKGTGASKFWKVVAEQGLVKEND